MIYFAKSMPAPPCLEVEKLKGGGTYNCEGVLERLINDFKNKCYICEDKEPHSINTEHFIPHRGDIYLKFDWNNLFFCCGHCNNTKGDNPIYDEMLNCTIRENEVDKKIRYYINPIPKECPVITALEDNPKVKNTVSLLEAVYNGTTPQKKLESANLRKKILSEVRKFTELLFAYESDEYNDEEKEQIKNQIVRQLRPSSNFTAFKRWIVRDSKYLSLEFEHLIEEE